MKRSLRIGAISVGIGFFIVGNLMALSLVFRLFSTRSTGINLLGLLVLCAQLGVLAVLVEWIWKIIQRRAHLHILPHLGLIAVLAMLLAGCTNVPPGYVGIRVNYWGSQKGVEDFPGTTGIQLYNPLSTSIFEFPTFVRTAIWTRSPHEGRKVNEEISYNSAEGLAFTADISLSYRLLPEKVPHFYVTFRSDHIDDFTHGFLRNVARDAFNEVAANYNADELYGTKKEEVLTKAKMRINDKVFPIGVVIEQFGYIGAPRPPDNVVDAINAKIRATQIAIQTENEIRAAKAEAQKSIAKANGEAQANQILTASLSPMLIQWRQLNLTQDAIQKWDGKRPMVEGGTSGLLLNITPQR